MSRYATVFSGILCLFQGVAAESQTPLWIRGLLEEGFPRLAEQELARAVRANQMAPSAVLDLRVRIWIVQQRFEEAADQMATAECPAALWLLLAKSAQAAQRTSIARRAYRHYLKGNCAPVEEALHNYAALLTACGETAAAISLYESFDSRSARAQLAALLVESDPDRALQLVESVQLGGLDQWFARSLVTWAQIEFARNPTDVQALLERQLALIRRLSASVDPSVSPLAGARYLLGCCYERTDRMEAALHQFYNVYVQFGDSSWGPPAYEKSQQIIRQIERRGRRVEIRSRERTSPIAVARRLFRDRSYARAIPLYLSALNEDPEGDWAIIAWRDLGCCWVHEHDERSVRMVAAYGAERFGGREQAGDALLALAQSARAAPNESLERALYELYLRSFP